MVCVHLKPSTKDHETCVCLCCRFRTTRVNKQISPSHLQSVDSSMGSSGAGSKASPPRPTLPFRSKTCKLRRFKTLQLSTVGIHSFSLARRTVSQCLEAERKASKVSNSRSKDSDNASDDFRLERRFDWSTIRNTDSDWLKSATSKSKKRLGSADVYRSKSGIRAIRGASGHGGGWKRRRGQGAKDRVGQGGRVGKIKGQVSRGQGRMRVSMPWPSVYDYIRLNEEFLRESVEEKHSSSVDDNALTSASKKHKSLGRQCFDIC